MIAAQMQDLQQVFNSSKSVSAKKQATVFAPQAIVTLVPTGQVFGSAILLEQFLSEFQSKSHLILEEKVCHQCVCADLILIGMIFYF